MAVEHAWTGVAHDLSDPLPHGRFVAVDGARGAFGFIVTEGALCEAFAGIVEEFPALRAEAFLRAVAATAEDLDHGFDGSAFGLQGWVVVGHGGVSCK